MGLFRGRGKNTLRISPTDWQDNYLVNKFKAGENVEIYLEDGPWGERLVITANKTQPRKARFLDADAVVDPDEHMVIVDASRNHVVVTLPPAHDFVGQLSIICADPTHGIEIVPNGSTSNVIFDQSNIAFNAKGDAITLTSDRGMSPPTPDPDEDPSDAELEEVGALSHAGEIPFEDVPFPGTWYVVGRYAALWYA